MELRSSLKASFPTCPLQLSERSCRSCEQRERHFSVPIIVLNTTNRRFLALSSRRFAAFRKTKNAETDVQSFISKHLESIESIPLMSFRLAAALAQVKLPARPAMTCPLGLAMAGVDGVEGRVAEGRRRVENFPCCGPGKVFRCRCTAVLCCSAAARTAGRQAARAVLQRSASPPLSQRRQRAATASLLPHPTRPGHPSEVQLQRAWRVTSGRAGAQRAGAQRVDERASGSGCAESRRAGSRRLGQARGEQARGWWRAAPAGRRAARTRGASGAESERRRAPVSPRGATACCARPFCKHVSASRVCGSNA